MMMRDEIDAKLVRRLVAGQFPQWADLAVTAVEPGGWDNRTFRLGDELSVRLPSAEGYVASVEKEQRWLPVLAPKLPLPIPEPIALGAPGEGYPFPWSVYRWMPGRTVEEAGVEDTVAFAEDLAGFLLALQLADATGGPAAGEHSFYRGADPAYYDAETREAIGRLARRIDGARATSIWEQGLAATWSGAPVWFHGDVAAGNLLVRDGRLSAVIDFGTCGVGDPACDLYIAWTFLRGESRAVFREVLGCDDGMWARGRAWTLWKALIMLRDGRAEARSTYEEILAES
jgi:aminoglycoside phosphotransferase (APT) family kinase protein